MKKITFTLISLIFSLVILAQEGNLGIFAGVGYYNGELNPRGVFYNPSLALGVLYRHNFDNRWSLRINANYSNLKGNDAGSNNTYQTQRNHSFSNVVWDIGPQIELNFLQYDKDKLDTYYFTPYITGGVLLSIFPDSQRLFELAVPVGFGFKYAITTEITAGMEWSYRWTNSDLIDGLEPDNFLTSPNEQRSYNPDTDLYSFFGAFVTIRVFKETSTCPAFMY